MITELYIKKAGFQELFAAQLTENTIFFFSNPSLKNKVVTELEKIWLLPDGTTVNSGISYATSQEGEDVSLDKTKANVQFLLTTIAYLKNGQKFTFTVEPAFIYAAKDWYDIWFVTEEDGEILCYPFSEFVGAKEAWDTGLDTVYLNFVQGTYGCYERYKNTMKGKYTLCRE